MASLVHFRANMLDKFHPSGSLCNPRVFFALLLWKNKEQETFVNVVRAFMAVIEGSKHLINST